MRGSRHSVIRRRHSAVVDELIEALDHLVATFCAAVARHDELSGVFGASTWLTSSTTRRHPRGRCAALWWHNEVSMVSGICSSLALVSLRTVTLVSRPVFSK